MSRNDGARAFAGSALGALIGFLALSGTASAGPFDSYYGEWRGVGHMENAQGDTASLACTAVCEEAEGGKAMQQSITCESPRAKFHAENFIVAEGDNIIGHWQEIANQVQGSLTGHLQGQLFVGEISTPTVTAKVWMRADNRSQAIRIEPQGQKVTRIEIVMKAAR